MASLFYKTGGNLVASIGYHSTNIIISQIILWIPVLNASYILGIETVINIALVVILKFLPVSVFRSDMTL